MGHQTLQSVLKTIGAVFLLAILGVVATGCGKKEVASADRTQVRVWRLDQDKEPFRNLIATFTKENQKEFPNLKVTYQQKDRSNYEFSALKSLAGGQGPDIWSIPNDWMGDYTDQVLTIPDKFFSTEKNAPNAAQSIVNLFPKGIAEQLIDVDGKRVYGLPTNADSLQLYINFNLLNDAYQDFRKSQGNAPKDEVLQPVHQLLTRAPVTWSDLVDQVKYITVRDGNTITRAGIALGTADNVPNSNDILQLLMYQNGADIVSKDHKSVLFQLPETTPSGGQVRPGENALDFFYSFANPAKSTYSWNASMPQALDAFTQGKVAMVIAYSDFGRQLRIKKPGFTPTVAPVPQISTSQTPVNYIKFNIETITKQADSPNAAANFLKAYTNSSMSKDLANLQRVKSPFLKNLTADGTFQAKQILTGKTTYKVNHVQFDAIFRQMIVDVSQNNIPVADAIKSGSDQIDKLLNPTLAAPSDQ